LEQKQREKKKALGGGAKGKMTPDDRKSKEGAGENFRGASRKKIGEKIFGTSNGEREDARKRMTNETKKEKKRQQSAQMTIERKQQQGRKRSRFGEMHENQNGLGQRTKERMRTGARPRNREED